MILTSAQTYSYLPLPTTDPILVIPSHSLSSVVSSIFLCSISRCLGLFSCFVSLAMLMGQVGVTIYAIFMAVWLRFRKPLSSMFDYLFFVYYTTCLANNYSNYIVQTYSARIHALTRKEDCQTIFSCDKF